MYEPKLVTIIKMINDNPNARAAVDIAKDQIRDNATNIASSLVSPVAPVLPQ